MIELEETWEGDLFVSGWSGATQTPNPKNIRDFRLYNWNGDGLSPNNLTTFKANNTGFLSVETVEENKVFKASFQAFEKDLFYAAYLDVSFETPGGDIISDLNNVDSSIFTISSEPVFLPRDLPFEECMGDKCYGSIV